MKYLLATCFLLCMTVFAKAQSLQTTLDSLHRIVLHAKNDTIRMDAFKSLSGYYDDVNLDSSVYYTGSCLLYTSPSPRDGLLSRMPSSA